MWLTPTTYIQLAGAGSILYILFKGLVPEEEEYTRGHLPMMTCACALPSVYDFARARKKNVNVVKTVILKIRNVKTPNHKYLIFNIKRNDLLRFIAVLCLDQ